MTNRDFLCPPMRSAYDGSGLLWQGAKLAEECGEVNEAIIKMHGAQRVAEECIDVIQVCESILRTLNFKSYGPLLDMHAVSQQERGYVQDRLI